MKACILGRKNDKDMSVSAFKIIGMVSWPKHLIDRNRSENILINKMGHHTSFWYLWHHRAMKPQANRWFIVLMEQFTKVGFNILHKVGAAAHLATLKVSIL